MIQTQLLKADKPYQIISAAGMVGIQVATLIVTEEKTSEDGSYQIDTHSHPVVNYGNKENLVEELKYYDGHPAERYKYTSRMQPEGAVWNKVEVRDVRVLGLVGAENLIIDLDSIIDLVPSLTPQNPLAHLWGHTTPSRIKNLLFDLEKFGIKVSRTINIAFEGYDSTQLIYLELEEEDGHYQVLVKIGDEDYYGFPPIYPLYFRSRLDEDPTDCINTIGRCFAVLYNHFKFEDKLRFVYNRKEADKGNKWADLLGKVTENLNNNWKSYLSEG